MKILFVTNYFPPPYVGGYELHCGRGAEWMARAGHSIRVLTGDFSLGPGRSELETSGLEVCRHLTLRYWTDVTDFGYWKREWRDVRLFRRHVRDFRPDVVVLWNMRKLASGLVLEAQRLCGSRLVYHLMDEWGAEFRKANGLPQFWARPASYFWGRLTKPLLRGLYRFFFTEDTSAWRPENGVVVSRALGDLCEQHGLMFPRRIVSYITYDPAVFGEPGKGSLPNDMVESRSVRFLWAGRLCVGKGLVTTLDALDLLYEKRPEADWTLDFCGIVDEETRTGVLEPRLIQSAWRGRVRYLGALSYDRMPAVYRAHDVFLFTSEVHEGLPGTIVEAFACGLPVIGTLTGGTRDVLRPGENCLTYPMGDARALVEVMEILLDRPDERLRLSAQVAKFAYEHCCNETVFPRLLAFYEELLARRAPVS
jgi:glycosyltransferase involved in cell wall biosynthesis